MCVRNGKPDRLLWQLMFALRNYLCAKHQTTSRATDVAAVGMLLLKRKLQVVHLCVDSVAAKTADAQSPWQYYLGSYSPCLWFLCTCIQQATEGVLQFGRGSYCKSSKHVSHVEVPLSRMNGANL